jgi:hypothetical protein
LDVEHEEMVVVTTFVVKGGSRLFLTNLQSRCRAAELWCCGEVSSSARGDDDRHARREEQRASGLAKVVKSNLGKPGLSSGRGRGRCGGQPFAAVASMPAGRYSRVVGGRVLSSLSARAGRRRLLTCVNANGEWLVWLAAILVVLFLAFPWFVKFII